jgi:nucleoside phosphorylase
MSKRVALIAPMPNELSPLVKMLGLKRTGAQGDYPVYSGRLGDNDVVATRTGIGPQLALDATERLLATGSFDHVLVSGIAGGIEPVTAVGDLVVPEEVVDSANGDRFRATPLGSVTPKGTIRMGGGESYRLTADDLTRLKGEGVIALDMETAAVARVCDGHGVPWTAFRSISDMAGDETVGEVVMTLANPDGSPNIPASLKFLVTHPRRIPRMVRLAREAQAAAVTAAKAAIAAARSL